MEKFHLEIGARTQLPTRFGTFDLQAFADSRGTEHLALSMGTLAENTLVRLHSECATGDIFGSMRCDCGQQLELALTMIAQAGQGLLIYLRGHEGRGIGLANKIKAYALQDNGMDTVDANLHLGFRADERDYDAAIAILGHYNLSAIRLLTNNRSKIKALEDNGIIVSATVPLWATMNPHNQDYVHTKLTRMGHIT